MTVWCTQFLQAATSCGAMSNAANYATCGGNATTFPALTVFDSLTLHNKSFKWYLNRTLINTTDGAAGSLAAPCASEEEGDSYFPDLCLDGVRAYKKQFRQYSEFFSDAAHGTLPHFSMIL